MGQRTQVLVIKENNKGKKKAHLFHNQWGFGRVMYLGLMDLLMQDYCKDTFAEGYDFLDCKFGTTNKFYDISDELPEGVEADGIDVDNFTLIRNIFEGCDNNNGGMVVYIKEDEPNYDQSHFKIGFLLGHEDEECEYDGEIYNQGNGKAFERWLSPREYAGYNGGSDYSDREFIDLFERFREYFNIELFE